MSLTYSKVSGVLCRSSQPFRRTHRHGCMAGYLCLMPTAFLPLRHNTNLTLTAFPSLATRHKICHPFGVPLIDVCLAGVPCFALHRLPVFFHAFWHYFIWNANGIDMKNPDKSLSGKSDEREVKMCKTWFFTHHSSFFILRKHSFRTAKHKLWPRQRPCFIASNITFHTTKHGLSRSETLPLANSYFVNHPIINQYLCNRLSVNELTKTSKNGVFRPSDSFVTSTPCFLGSKFEYSLTKSHYVKI